MTELNHQIRLLSARAAALNCRVGEQRVIRDIAEDFCAQLLERTGQDEPRLIITLPVPIPESFADRELFSKRLKTNHYCHCGIKIWKIPIISTTLKI